MAFPNKSYVYIYTHTHIYKRINYKGGTKYYAKDKRAKYFHIVLIVFYFPIETEHCGLYCAFVSFQLSHLFSAWMQIQREISK